MSGDCVNKSGLFLNSSVFRLSNSLHGKAAYREKSLARSNLLYTDNGVKSLSY